MQNADPKYEDYNARVYEAATLHGLQRLVQAGFAPGHVRTERDNELVAANFPPLDVQLHSPAFAWPESVDPEFAQGRAGPTDQMTFDRFVEQITERNSWIEIRDCAFLSEEGRRFRYFLLSSTGQQPGLACGRSKLRVWIQSGVHGNEPAADQAVLALLGKLDRDADLAKSILDKTDILIFPQYNPDGIADFNRPCNLGVDLNRDHIRLAVPQTASIRGVFCEFAPHIAVDMHEYSAKARYGGLTHASDVMFSAAKNLNIHPAIREISEELFVTEIGRRLEERQLRFGPYVPTDGISIFFREGGSDGKIGRNAMGLTQCISFLCEVRGIGIADQHFQRRTTAALAFVEAVLQVAVDHAETIGTTLEHAIDDFVHSSQNVVIQDKRRKVDCSFMMIDTLSGELVQQSVQLASTTPSVPNLIRKRPEAYVFPAGMLKVAEHLRELGIVVETLTNELRGCADVLTVTRTGLGRTYHEGIVPVHVTVECLREEVCMPASSFLVSTRQRHAALAFIALEPENVDSYVSCNIIAVGKQRNEVWHTLHTIRGTTTEKSCVISNFP